MPLEPKVEDIEALDDSVKSFYVEDEKNGGFILDVVKKDGYELSNTENLRSALAKERVFAADYKSKYEAFGDLDPETINQKLTRLEELEKIDPSKEADKLLDARVESFKAQTAEKHKKELDNLSGKLSKTEEYLKKLHIDDAAKSAIMAAGGDERTVTYMLDKVIKRLSVAETESGFVTQVRDESGAPMIGDGDGYPPMSVQQLVEKMKGEDIWSHAFPGKGTSGGGIPASTTSGGKPASTTQKKDIKSLTPTEKSALLKEVGIDKWIEMTSQ